MENAMSERNCSDILLAQADLRDADMQRRTP